MKVYINGRFLTQPVTGVQRFAREVTRSIDTLLDEGWEPAGRHEWTIVVPGGAAGYADLYRNIPVRDVSPLHGHPWEQFVLPWATRDGLLLSLGSTGPVLKGRQVVYMHDASVFAVPQAYSRVFTWWYRILLTALGRRARRIQTNSEFSKAELARYLHLGKRPVDVVYPGGDGLDGIAPDTAILEREGLVRDGFVLGSGHSWRKNAQVVIDAVAGTPDDGPSLVIVGANRAVENMVPVAASKRVKLLGHVTDAELVALMQHALCMVFPSRYEGFGLPPVEAMRAGCPLVLSDRPALPEICGDAALYCDPDDAACIRDAILRLRDDDALREELRRKGRDRGARYLSRESAMGVVAGVNRALARRR